MVGSESGGPRSFEPGPFDPGRASVPYEPARWPADPHPTAPQPLAVTDRPATRIDAVADRPWARARGAGCLFWLAGVLALVLVIGLGLRSLHLWPNFDLSTRTTDNSPPTLLVSITDLARFEAASGTFEKVVDIKKDKSWLPDFIYSEHVLFICVGSVDAYVDFSHVGQGDIDASSDHKTVTVKLPAPQLEKPNIDHDQSHVFSVDKGVANKISSLFGNDANSEQKLYQLGEQQIAQAARDSKLTQVAADNTRQMLTQLLRSLGYTSITVKFASP
jgi:hypothetical protein